MELVKRLHNFNDLKEKNLLYLNILDVMYCIV